MREKDGTPQTSGRVVKKWKYDDNYLDFSFILINVNNEEQLQCVLCMKVLAPECTLPSRLKCHLD